MHPLRSEADAFADRGDWDRRRLVTADAAHSPRDWGAWAALIGFGAGLAWRSSGTLRGRAAVARRRRQAAPAGSRQPNRRRPGAAGRSEPQSRWEDRDPRRHPALAAWKGSPLSPDLDEARVARQRMGFAAGDRRWVVLAASRRLGAERRDRGRAARFPADEIIISTHPLERSLARAGVDRARSDRAAGHARGRRSRSRGGAGAYRAAPASSSASRSPWRRRSS